MEARKNAGYTIISSVRVSEITEIVIGHNEKAPNAFVVWYCKNEDDYFCGAYCNSYKSALERLIERVKGVGIL